MGRWRVAPGKTSSSVNAALTTALLKLAADTPSHTI